MAWQDERACCFVDLVEGQNVQNFRSSMQELLLSAPFPWRGMRSESLLGTPSHVYRRLILQVAEVDNVDAFVEALSQL